MKPKRKTQPYQYGRDPNPANWHEAADAIKSHQKPKGNPVFDRLDSIAKSLKDKK